jgi:KDO2-lipid IV(A) lauroyltransferase
MYGFTKAVANLLSKLSFQSLEKLAHFLTFIFFDILRFRRALMLKNLDIAFPDKYTRGEKVKIARASFSHFLQTIFEVLISEKHPIDADVEVIGGEHLTKALADEKGAFILAFHMGNWEAMGAVITKRFRPAYTVVKKVGGDGLNKFVEERRLANGLYWIGREKTGDAVRQMFKILKDGKIVGFIMDQARPGEPRLPFFSKDAKTNTSLAAIWARRTTSPVMSVCIYRKAFGKHVLTLKGPLELRVSDDPAADILHNSLIFNREVEANVRLHPEQYFWFHNRWK